MKKREAALECSVCRQRNYRIPVSESSRTKALEIKKFCKYCKGHTMHRKVTRG